MRPGLFSLSLLFLLSAVLPAEASGIDAKILRYAASADSAVRPRYYSTRIYRTPADDSDFLNRAYDGCNGYYKNWSPATRQYSADEIDEPYNLWPDTPLLYLGLKDDWIKILISTNSNDKLGFDPVGWVKASEVKVVPLPHITSSCLTDTIGNGYDEPGVDLDRVNADGKELYLCRYSISEEFGNSGTFIGRLINKVIVFDRQLPLEAENSDSLSLTQLLRIAKPCRLWGIFRTSTGLHLLNNP